MNQMCVHHWMIEPPNGPLSKGTCRKCNAEAMFPNNVVGISAWWDLADMASKRRFEAKERKTRMDFALSSIPQRVNR